VRAVHVIVMSVGLMVPFVIFVIPIGIESALTGSTGEETVPSPTLFFALSL
jgi:hypothetical protein